MICLRATGTPCYWGRGCPPQHSPYACGPFELAGGKCGLHSTVGQTFFSTGMRPLLRPAVVDRRPPAAAPAVERSRFSIDKSASKSNGEGELKPSKTAWRRMMFDESLLAATVEKYGRSSLDEGEPPDFPQAELPETVQEAETPAGAPNIPLTPASRAIIIEPVHPPPALDRRSAADCGRPPYSHDDGEGYPTSSDYNTSSGHVVCGLPPLPPKQGLGFQGFCWVPGGLECAASSADETPKAAGDVGGLGFIGLNSLFPDQSLPTQSRLTDGHVRWPAAAANRYTAGALASGHWRESTARCTLSHYDDRR